MGERATETWAELLSLAEEGEIETREGRKLPQPESKERSGNYEQRTLWEGMPRAERERESLTEGQVSESSVNQHIV